ncbi:MAG: S-layer homology domain-containing protein [Firmicutes bacterium]|nr:S-layer homology domain-containing protein [Bacillota bacterium]
MKNLFRKITVLVLSLCLIAGMTGLPAAAYAEGPDDAAIVAADKEALAIGLSVTDSVYGVTDDLTLPLTGVSGSAITWLSDTPEVIAHDGTVTRPAADAEDAEVTLTAAITYGEASDTKAFTVMVLKEGEPQMLFGPMSEVVWVGDGLSADTAYQVSSAEHLAAIPEKGLNAYYVQTAPIDLSAYPNWTPFGTYAAPFTAHYDGGGYVISGLTVTGSNNDASLFGFVSGNAVIKNVCIQNATVTGNLNVGILAGIIADGGGATGGGTIQNCSTSGTVSGSARVGGLIGSVQHGSAVVKESFSTATVSADPSNSNQRGTAGGLAGFVLSGLVQDSYAAGDITGGNLTGGFAGEIQGGTVNNCYANGSVAGTSAKGFVSGKSGGTVSGCFYNSDTGLSDPAATGKSAAEMKRRATFVPWDFAAVWKIGDDISTPSLQWQEPWTDDEIISTDLAALKWDDIKGGNISIHFVTGNLAQFPVTGLKGAAITWSAVPTGYIDTATGALIKKEETEDVTVTLTAEASCGTGAARTKAFVLTVKKLELERYAVVYDANGGTGTPPTESDKAENEPFQAAAADNLQPPAAMLFKEWNTAANGTGAGYGAGATVTMPGNALTLYAIWEIVWIGNGSSQNPFQVPSAAHLDAVRHNMGAHYILTADINLSASGYTNWVAIGTNSNMFTGVFNGNGKRIIGLTIDRSGTEYQGLFGAIGSGGLVKNLGLADVSVTGNNYVGGVAGQISGGKVESCYVSGSVTGAGSVGGIVGRFTTGEVRNCYSESDVSGSGSNVGGVAGQIQNGQMFLCYATGNVSGNSFAGGVAGRMLNEGIVMLCAALNPGVTAAGNGGSRVINVPGTRTDDNYAFNGMTVTANGAAKAIKAGVRLADGENLSFDSLFSESFWKDTLYFNTSTIWLIEDYKLPVLRNLAGQNGAPPHLIKIFVDAAKNAAEGATYSDMTQAAATGEAAIANALKSDAEAAVNNSSVTVTINKVSYTAPTAGDADNPNGTNGSYVFTVTVSRGLQSQTTAQKTITITATAFTGLSNAAAVDAAKAALTDGSVNVAFGASQSDKTEAVQSYVNGLLSAVPNAAGVTANVTYNSTTGQYDVELAKGNATDSMSLTMTVNEAPDPDIATVGNAKTAAENAAYSNMTQAAASSENAIKTALRNTAVTAVNSGSVDVTVNTVSYLVPVAGTSANPSGTNGSYTFTITVSKGLHSQTTAQKTITITAAAYTSPSRPGSGRNNSSPSGILVTSSGKDATDSGVSLSFPAGTVESDIRVQIREAALTSGMSLPDNSQLISKVVDIVKNRSGNFAQPVTITMSFNKSQIDPEKYDIKICYFDEQSGEWVELDNIEVDLDGSAVSGQVNHFTKFAVIATLRAAEKEQPSQTPAPQPEIKLPADVAGHWGKDSIAKLMQAGVIGGYPDGSFQPEKSVSRAEFTVMLVKALKLESKEGDLSLRGARTVFSDTAAHWAKDNINAAAARGIISGYDQNSFGPDDQITREQAAVIIARAAKLQAGDQALSFSDAQHISPWALSGVAAAVGKSYLSGYPDNSFRPRGYTSRAEAAAIIAKLLY